MITHTKYIDTSLHYIFSYFGKSFQMDMTELVTIDHNFDIVLDVVKLLYIHMHTSIQYDIFHLRDGNSELSNFEYLR